MPDPRQDQPNAPGHRAADAAEKAVRETAETARKETRAFADRAAAETSEAIKAAEAVTDEAGRTAAAALRVMEQATPDPAAVSRATEALAARMRELSNEWVQAFRDQTAKNLEGVARLAECRSPLDLMRVQTELAREGLNDSVILARRLNTASLRTLGAIAQDSASAATSRAKAR